MREIQNTIQQQLLDRGWCAYSRASDESLRWKVVLLVSMGA